MKNILRKSSADTLQIIFIFLPFLLLIFIYQLERWLDLGLPDISLEHNFFLWLVIYFIGFTIIFVLIKFYSKAYQNIETCISNRPYLLALIWGFILGTLHLIGVALFNTHVGIFANFIHLVILYLSFVLIIYILSFFSVFFKESKKLSIIHTVLFHILTQLLILISYIWQFTMIYFSN